jgi:two-component sensor histidine kinase
LILEALLFSFLLSDKIKHLHQAKIASQQKYIDYKNKEGQRLTSLVNEKTAKLKHSLEQKETLLQELNHRVKNSMQTIVSFVRLQIDELDNERSIQLLQDVERRVLAINHLYALLHTHTNISSVYAYEFFTLIADDIEMSFQKENIKIHIETAVRLPSKTAVYCGLIVNEAITNSFKYAFDDTQQGLIEISFFKQGAQYNLTIKDNGCGYDKNRTVDGFGLFIMQKLAVEQLNGQIVTDSDRGVLIQIIWREK